MINLKSGITPTWCPGCNNFLLFAGIQQAIDQLGIAKENVVLVFDIGCIGNMADFFNTYSVHSLHGRCIPTALGVKLANPKLTVIAIGGDGGVYGEGMGHLIAAARADAPITVVVSDNHLYSLTTGQTSPTTPKGSKTKSTPLGSISVPINPVSLLHTINPDVMVDSIDGRDPQLITAKLVEALKHPGFSLLDLQQICVTFGKELSA
ncbi:MAG: thiamine pyrophosphate-dependent enzyme [Candidatus Shapirobacteria bacterium]|nr:thiamine pyrophosphate-dependent enzyme [Candidatus Shapirobacteria bacterium]